MKFLEYFYGTLFSPMETFEKIKEEENYFPVALFIVIVVSAFISTLNFDFFNNGFFYIFSLFGAVFTGLFAWFIFGLYFRLTARVFNNEAKLKTFLTLSGFALLPWIFTAPLQMLKDFGIPFLHLGVFLNFLVWGWVIFLQVIAISKTFNISIDRAILSLLLPFVGFVLFSWWSFGFFVTLSQLII